MTIMIGTVEVMAHPCSRMGSFLYSGLALWGRRTPWTDLHRQINQQWHLHCFILWRNSPMSSDRCQLPSPLCSSCTDAGHERMQRDDGSSISFSDTFRLSHSPFFLSSFNFSFPPDLFPFSLFPCLPHILIAHPLPISLHSHLLTGFPSRQPHICPLKLHILFPHLGLPFCHLLSLGLSLCLSPPTER